MKISREEFSVFLEETIFELYPDYTVEEWQAFTTYHWGTMLEWRFSGTHEGRVGDTEPTGSEIALPIVSIVTIGEDGITTWMDFFDPHVLDEQPGRT